jgi:hypothetical protein
MQAEYLCNQFAKARCNSLLVGDVGIFVQMEPANTTEYLCNQCSLDVIVCL